MSSHKAGVHPIEIFLLVRKKTHTSIVEGDKGAVVWEKRGRKVYGRRQRGWKRVLKVAESRRERGNYTKLGNISQ